MICKFCQKEIKKEERTVLLKTFDNKKVYEELYFHINCWIQDMKERDEKRAIQLYETSMKTSMGILKNIIGNNGKESNKSIVLQKGNSEFF